MENTIKQSENERERGLETVRRLHEEYKPLRNETDRLCNFLGLDNSPGLEVEENIAEYVAMNHKLHVSG